MTPADDEMREALFGIAMDHLSTEAAGDGSHVVTGTRIAVDAILAELRRRRWVSGKELEETVDCCLENQDTKLWQAHANGRAEMEKELKARGAWLPGDQVTPGMEQAAAAFWQKRRWWQWTWKDLLTAALQSRGKP